MRTNDREFVGRNISHGNEIDEVTILQDAEVVHWHHMQLIVLAYVYEGGKVNGSLMDHSMSKLQILENWEFKGHPLNFNSAPKLLCLHCMCTCIREHLSIFRDGQGNFVFAIVRY